MHPVGMKKVILTLVEKWKEIVDKNDAKEECKQLEVSDLSASLPTLGIRTLREMLALVIASYDLTLFYEQMLSSAHDELGTRVHPIWCDDSWEIDFERMVTHGLGSLTDRDIALLSLHPGAIVIAHECVREEIMQGDIISNVWHKLVGQAYESHHQQLVTIVGEINGELKDNKRFTTTEYTEDISLTNISIQRKSLLLSLIGGDQAKVEQEAAIAIAERSASQVEYEPTKTCSQCGETMKTGDESCGTCKYSAGENYHIEDVTDDFEDMSYLEDSGASLSANSLEKLEAKKILAYGYASS